MNVSRQRKGKHEKWSKPTRGLSEGIITVTNAQLLSNFLAARHIGTLEPSMLAKPGIFTTVGVG